jgi:hypothetical protein
MAIKLANPREMSSIDHVLFNTKTGILTARRMDGTASRNAIFDLGDGKTANQVMGVKRLEVEEFVRELHMIAGHDRYEFACTESEGDKTVEYVRQRIAATREISPPPELMDASRHRTPVTLENFPIPGKLKKNK